MKKYQFGYPWDMLTIPEIVKKIWSLRGDYEYVIAPTRLKSRLFFGASFPYAPISLLNKVGVKYTARNKYGVISKKSELEKLIKFLAKTDKKFLLHTS